MWNLVNSHLDWIRKSPNKNGDFGPIMCLLVIFRNYHFTNFGPQIYVFGASRYMYLGYIESFLGVIYYIQVDSDAFKVHSYLVSRSPLSLYIWVFGSKNTYIWVYLTWNLVWNYQLVKYYVIISNLKKISKYDRNVYVSTRFFLHFSEMIYINYTFTCYF